MVYPKDERILLYPNYQKFRIKTNLFSLLLKLTQLMKIGTDLQFCIFCWAAIAFLIVVIEDNRRIG